jgi:hypothetical protein
MEKTFADSCIRVVRTHSPRAGAGVVAMGGVAVGTKEDTTGAGVAVATGVTVTPGVGMVVKTLGTVGPAVSGGGSTSGELKGTLVGTERSDSGSFGESELLNDLESLLVDFFANFEEIPPFVNDFEDLDTFLPLFFLLLFTRGFICMLRRPFPMPLPLNSRRAETSIVDRASQRNINT